MHGRNKIACDFDFLDETGVLLAERGVSLGFSAVLFLGRFGPALELLLVATEGVDAFVVVRHQRGVRQLVALVGLRGHA